MRKLKPKSKKPKIHALGKAATDQNIIEWATQHDPFERLEAASSTIVEDHSDLNQLLEKSLYQENSAQLNMRVPPAMRTLLTKLARERTTEATTLARIWLVERIRKELGGGRK
ncbi:MAG: hypothetical protein HYR55_00170 [Acidobacteria bacterium]|nr:hypothetical protein [Acidobacteriota bacterium]MBI3655415.1 hypothetical protein [Acidobacteriota bacterium]